MEPSNRPLTPTPRRLFPPVVVLALAWAGAQLLLLFYLYTSVGPLLRRDPHVARELGQVLAASFAHGISISAWIRITNLAFVVLLWFRFRASRPWPDRGELYRVLAVFGGTAALLLVVNTLWAGF